MREKKWVLRQTPGDYKAIAAEYGIEPVAAITACNRGVAVADFPVYFHAERQSLHDPALLKDADLLTDILIQKISEKKQIRVIGDYDIDGVCATYILYDALQNCGAKVDYAIPHRVTDGYGLNIRLVDEALREGVDTILTCDNGIAAEKECAYAKEHGMTVLVSDHHEIPFTRDAAGNRVYRMPPADAVVDIKRQDETYPFCDICGAVVAWKLMQLLEQKCGLDIDTWRYVEQAGFATIGDVMVLQGENRVITALGLDAMRHSQNAGFRALMQVCEIAPETLRCHHVGFRLGPCINATGRLESAMDAERLLCCKSDQEAAETARKLHALNNERQQLTEEAVERCLKHIGECGMEHDAVLVLYEPTIHESVAGIVAGRLRERFYRPVIVLTASEGVAKGSARSIPGYDMFEKLSECGELFLKFGGHTMAAGMSLETEKVEELRTFLNLHHGMQEETLTEKLMIDVCVPFSYLTVNMIEGLEALEPFGNGNEKPLFAAKGCRVHQTSLMGAEKNHLRLVLSDDSGARRDAVYFRGGQELLREMKESGADVLDIAYTPQINVYQGNRSVQLLISDYRMGAAQG